mmetsp:Transcript_20898/g.64986  ORF Transcript_20898/g.64986 Transcript_20898/m.64986 type:complete len:279 (-) Transcript_20898:409-1245(-)
MSTSECLLAQRMIVAVSSISAMNVERPRAWQSPAPTRARIASVSEMVASSHGTKQPACARRTEMPAARMYVDLPPMLGPVTIWKWEMPCSRATSFGMNPPAVDNASMHGCRQPRSTMRRGSEAATIVGRTYGTGAETAATASAALTSRSASVAAHESITGANVPATCSTLDTRAACFSRYPLAAASQRVASARVPGAAKVTPSFFVPRTVYADLLRSAGSSLRVTRRSCRPVPACATSFTLSASFPLKPRSAATSATCACSASIAASRSAKSSASSGS